MRRLAWVTMLAGLTAGTHAVAERQIRRGTEFWLIPTEAREETWAVDFEYDVYYADPLWHNVWGTVDGIGVYLPLAQDHPLELKSGQRVRLRGTVVPSRGFAREDIQVTVLAEGVWPQPRRVAGDSLLVAHEAWTELSGLVTMQEEIDATHMGYRLIVDGRAVMARLLVGPTDPLPQLQGMRVTMRGVYVTATDPAGRLLQSDLWIPRSRDIEVLGPLTEDERFRLPRTAIEDLAASAGKEWVRVTGTVHTREAGEYLSIRDGTGQLAVVTAQSAETPVGAEIEVVGRVEIINGAVVLRSPIVRLEGVGPSAPDSGGAALPKLRVTAQVLELDARMAERGHPVSLRGVVTWSHPSAEFFFIEDATGGVRVTRGGTRAPPVGHTLRLQGVTRMGEFAPEVQLEQAATDTTLARPMGRLVLLDQAMSGREEARWLALRGYLRSAELEGSWRRLDLVAATGEFQAYLPPEVEAADLVGTVVRVAGVCVARADGHGRMTGFRLWVPDRTALQVEEEEWPDPFAGPRVTILSLQQFNPRQAALPRVRVVGRMIAQEPGRQFFLQDETAGVRVLTGDARRIPPGAAVEVVGFLGREGPRPVLREGQWRQAGESTAAAEVLPIGDPAVLRPEAEARLVSMEGLLLDQHPRGQEVWLTLEGADNRVFEASLPGTSDFTPGSRLRLTGVYLVERDEAGRPRSFELRLREPGDVAVLATPSWWTARRLLGVLAVAVVGALAAMGWIVALRRQVGRQTAQIREFWEREVRMQAELERSTRLESLGVLAGGLAHDFNNLLAAILGNLGLIALDSNAMSTSGSLVENARRATRRAGDLTQQLLTFAKGGEPIRNTRALPELVREAAEFALHGAHVRAEFDFSPTLPAAEVDAAQLSRVIHNLVLNAVQAMPAGGVVTVALQETRVEAGERGDLRPGLYVLLTVADRGAGIPPAELARIFEPYFSTKQGSSGLGLAVVRSIVQKHEGHVAVESLPGKGTTFRIWLPASSSTAPTEAGESLPPPVASGRRVLLMDDEEIIREVAVQALETSGHRATAVAEGKEAVRAFVEARAAGRPFDVVILDLTVPGGMGGEQTVRELLRIDPGARVIVSSGYSSNPVMARYRDYGFCAVVPKPYELNVLLHAVETAASSALPVAST